MPSRRPGPNTGIENPPPNEEAQINENAKLMEQLLDRRYKGKDRFLRGVHPKDHGCVLATFTVAENIPPEWRAGVFKKPGDTFRAAIRFSNASAISGADSPQDTGPPLGDPLVGPDKQPVLVHGSRGMAIKLYDVNGPRMVPDDGERNQDFLMINQPVFAFANAEDYLELNKAILPDEKFAFRFFGRMGSPDKAVRERAAATLQIVQRIKSRTNAPPPYQPAPMSPLDNTYFSAAPFSLGEGKVMKFAARPVNPMPGDPGDSIKDPDYMRNAMRKRMVEAKGKDICFDFQVQVRDAKKVGDVNVEIENACTEWKDPWVTVARITIPPQNFDSEERKDFCEKLFYTPFHGLVDHWPLGGINRLRRQVYDVSAIRRKCPVSPGLPPEARRGPPIDPGSGRPAEDKGFTGRASMSGDIGET